MSAHDGGNAWDLRCHVREKIMQNLHHSYPDSLRNDSSRTRCRRRQRRAWPTNGEEASKAA